MQRLEMQLCPAGQSAARAHGTHKPRLASQTKSVEPHSRLSLHPCGLTHAPLLQRRPDGQSASAVQVSFGTLTIPPVPPEPEEPAGPEADPPAPVALSLPETPPEAPPAELSLTLPPLKLLPALLLLEVVLDEAPCPLEPPELAEEDVPPAPPES